MKKCEICGKWLKNTRGYNIHYRMMHVQKTSKINLEEILNRIRKLELDNNFMKHQLKHKSFVIKSKDSDLDWDIPKEVKELIDVYEVKFNDIVKELKSMFTGNFDYHNILSPVNPIEEIVSPPVIIVS